MDKLSIFKKIDKYFGNFCLSFINAPVKENNDIKNILLIKTIAIGDLVVLLPTIKALREIFADAKITLLTTPRVKEVVEGFEPLDEIIYYDILGSEKGIFGFIKKVKELKANNYDLSIDFEHYYNFTAIMSRLAAIKQIAGFEIGNQKRSKLFNEKLPYKIDKHEVEAFYEAARCFGAKEEKVELEEIVTSDDDKRHVNNFLKDNEISKNDLLIGVHPTTSKSAVARRWQNEKFAQVIDVLIKDYKAKVVITGTPADKEVVADVVSLLTTNHYSPITMLDFSLKQFAELARRCNLFISLDTGPMHIAAAMGTRTIGLFGPNTPARWGPYGYGDLAIYKDIKCSPCTKQYLGQVSKCKTGECMKEISVDDVLTVVKEALKKSNIKNPISNIRL